MVIGDHGENMIPYPEISGVGGVPLKEIIGDIDMKEIIDNTKAGGAEIVKHLGTSAFYAPGRAIAKMVEAILDDSRIVIPSCVMLDGEYGQKDVTVGVPVVLGAKGVEKIIELELDDDMKARFQVSVDSIREGIKILRENKFFD